MPDIYPLILPAYVSLLGLCQHAAVGALLAVLLRKLGAPTAAILVSTLAVGVAHEQAQRDWTRGEPVWFVIIEVLLFVLGAWWALTATARRFYGTSTVSRVESLSASVEHRRRVARLGR